VQFEWFEAARRAGLTSKVQLCQGLLQTDAGDVVMDSITFSAADLPTLPGVCLEDSFAVVLVSNLWP
jgi:hypothetical protein